jgi:hypothetical protein
MPVRLTEQAISKALREAASGVRRDLADAGCRGLRLRPTRGGVATWVLACRDRQGLCDAFPSEDIRSWALVRRGARPEPFTHGSNGKVLTRLLTDAVTGQ